MKQFLLLCLLVSISYSATSQYSRTFYTTYSAGHVRGFGLAEINGSTQFLSIKESELDTLHLLYGLIDGNGETSDYHESIISSLNYNNVALSGVGKDSNSGDMIAVLITNTTQGAIHYVRVNQSAGTASLDYSLPYVFERPFARTRQKGDSLITYITEENVGLVRIASSISNLTAHSYQLVAAGLTVTGGLAGDARRTELKIDASGNEYVCSADKLFKRTSSGSVTSVTLTGINAFEPAGKTLGIGGGGYIAVITDSKYALYDNSLNYQSSGTINFPVNGGFKFNELIYENGVWVLYTAKIDQYLARVDLDNGMNVIQSKMISERRCKPLDIVSETSGKYLLLEKRDQINAANPELYSEAIIKFGTNLPDEFIEFGQSIKHHPLDVHIGHLGVDFLDQNISNGIMYEFNGIKRPLYYFGWTWLLGFDDNNQLDLDLERNTNPPSERPGPFTSVFTNAHELYDQCNRGYYVDRDMIDLHIQAITNNDPNYVIPLGIREWPAHGDIQAGQTADIAPFFDANNNGIYEPELGEYPKIFGSRCVLNVFHEVPVGLTSTNPSGLEHHQYFYVFDCDTSDVLNNTVFLTERIFARTGNYTQAVYSKYCDSDLGNYGDDYIGTNVDLGMVYFYNGDNYDDDIAGYSVGFHDTLPAFGVQFLKGVPLPDDGVDNAAGGGLPVNGYGFGDGQIDNECSTLESSLRLTQGYVAPSEFYNVMHGVLPNGTPNSVNGVDIRYDYFGDTDPTFYASGGINHGNAYFEGFSGNVPGDRFIFGSSSEFDLYANGQNMIEFTTAHIAAVDTNMASFNNIDPVKKLFFMGTFLKSMFEANDAGCNMTFDPYISDESVGVDELETLDFSIYPNPVEDELTVMQDFANQGVLTITSISGHLILKVETGKETKISTSRMAPGVYLVTLQTARGVITKQLIKR